MLALHDDVSLVRCTVNSSQYLSQTSCVLCFRARLVLSLLCGARRLSLALFVSFLLSTGSSTLLSTAHHDIYSWYAGYKTSRELYTTTLTELHDSQKARAI